ncbi:ferredoxin-type protein NapF [Curvivirga sp.]|uniref:ferredoxin-type protein NapF n=1 Tax=Curvivirga sp. TaxID=2856848 RepID=UPI003B595B0D
MSVNLQRRGFLRGSVKPVPNDIPLPWTSHQSIEDNCTRCDACITACPTNIIIKGDGGFPKLDFNSGECEFCEECAKSCNEDVFDLSQTPTIQAILSLNLETCLPEKGIHCEACRDSCPEGAIRMKMRIGKPPQPEINSDRCTNCGACASPCPVDAISFSYSEPAILKKVHAHV